MKATPETSRILAVDVVGELGALDPEKAQSLASAIVSGHRKSPTLVIDLNRVGALSSGFANALFLRLAEEAPLSDWRPVLRFENLSAQTAEVLASSLRAVRNALAERTTAT